MLPQMRPQARVRALARGTRLIITADATDRARAMVVEELGHGFAQHVASRPPRSLIGVLRSSYRTNKLDNLLWRGHGS